MSKIIERCAGIDIGKRFLLCCVVTGAAHEESRSQTLCFDTTVPALELMSEWLQRNLRQPQFGSRFIRIGDRRGSSITRSPGK